MGSLPPGVRDLTGALPPGVRALDDAPPPAPAEDPNAPSALEAGLRGVKQGATLGFGDELTGGAEALYDKIRGHKEAIGDLYVKHRDEARANDDAAAKAHPVAYGAGNVVGGLAPLAIPGVGEAALGLKGAAAVGAGVGAAAGLGNSTADLTKGDVGGALRDAAVGAGTGALAGAAGHGVAKAAGAAADALPALQGHLGDIAAKASAAPAFEPGEVLKHSLPLLALGHPIPAAIAAGGAVLSGTAKKVGAVVGQKALQAVAEPGPITGAVGRVTKMLANPASLGRYAGVLSSAAKQGPERLAATHYVLNSTDPTYRQHMASAADEANEDDEVEQ